MRKYDLQEPFKLDENYVFQVTLKKKLVNQSQKSKCSWNKK